MIDRPTLPEPSFESPPALPRRSMLRRLRVPLIGAVALATVGAVVAVAAPSAQASVPFAIESLDGSANNAAHPTWGQANQPYARVGAAHYADGVSAPMT